MVFVEVASLVVMPSVASSLPFYFFSSLNPVSFSLDFAQKLWLISILKTCIVSLFLFLMPDFIVGSSSLSSFQLLIIVSIHAECYVIVHSKMYLLSHHLLELVLLILSCIHYLKHKSATYAAPGRFCRKSKHKRILMNKKLWVN